LELLLSSGPVFENRALSSADFSNQWPSSKSTALGSLALVVWEEACRLRLQLYRVFYDLRGHFLQLDTIYSERKCRLGTGSRRPGDHGQDVSSMTPTMYAVRLIHGVIMGGQTSICHIYLHCRPRHVLLGFSPLLLPYCRAAIVRP
jgi:hypothetical protein